MRLGLLLMPLRLLLMRMVFPLLATTTDGSMLPIVLLCLSVFRHFTARAFEGDTTYRGWGWGSSLPISGHCNAQTAPKLALGVSFGHHSPNPRRCF